MSLPDEPSLQCPPPRLFIEKVTENHTIHSAYILMNNLQYKQPQSLSQSSKVLLGFSLLLSSTSCVSSRPNQWLLLSGQMLATIRLRGMRCLCREWPSPLSPRTSCTSRRWAKHLAPGGRWGWGRDVRGVWKSSGEKLRNRAELG